MNWNVTDSFFDFAGLHPDAIAVIDGDRPISYGVLRNGVCLAARQFEEAGWRPGDVVGISVAGSQASHLVAALALARSGIAHVALPANEPLPLLRSRMRRAGVSALVCDSALAADTTIGVVKPDSDWLQPLSLPPRDLRCPGGSAIWLISETSGTTAEPKLLGISHAAERGSASSQAGVFSHKPGERCASLSGLNFLIGIKHAVRCLADGATVALPPPVVNYAQLLNWIDVCHVTYLSCVPLHLYLMLAEAGADSPRLPRLRILRSTAAELPGAAVQAIRRRISPNLHTLYGTSEAGPIAVATPQILAEHPTSVGRVLPGVELQIVNERDEPLASGAVGFVRLRGPGVAGGYLRADPEEQARAFRGGWFYPGDLATKNEDDLLYLKGRADDVMNFDGILVGPSEIESVVRQHPGVIEAAAFAVPSLEHQDVPAVAIVASQPLPIDELSRFCNDRLGVRAPRFFMQVGEIPKNPMGKVLRRRLSELAQAKLQEGARR